jgi:ADP-heptose:LPS heptosyltransferase
VGAGAPSKLWPPERFAAVAAHLGGAWRLSSMVVWAGAREREWAERIVAEAGGHARLAPQTTLGHLAALSRRARLFVSSDTGPLHIAAAVGTACVGLFGPWPAERNGPYGPRHIALEERTFEGSSRQRRNAPPELMLAITVPLVSDACDRILRRSASAGA